MAAACYAAFAGPGLQDLGVRVGHAAGGLVAAYGFNEGSGSSVLDLSGNANHGTISGATWTTTAKYGSALSFDGTNDVVTIADSSSLDLTTALTLEAWVRPASTNNWRTVLLKEVPGELAYALYASENGGRPGAWLRINGTSLSVDGTARLTGSVWSHLAATYDGAALRLYVNGALVQSRVLTGSIQTSGNPLRIGGNSVSGQYFRGQIDDVRIYNRALAVGEIQADMNIPVNLPADTTPPAVSVTDPVEGATVADSITVAASSTDNVGVTGVQFLLDGGPLGAEDTLAPYSIPWNTASSTNGPHVLSARARDGAGNTTTSAQVSVTVSNPPVLIITRPTNGSTISGGTVDVTYTTTGDLAGIDHVHFVLDGTTAMDVSFDGTYRFTAVPPGAHVLGGYLAHADHTKVVGSDGTPAAFTTTMPDQTPPVLTMTAPSAGAVLSAAVLAQASASDNVGVVGVQFLIDGVAVGPEDTTDPFGIVWDTLLTSNGPHSVSARARDAAGNTTTAPPVDVVVANTTGPAVTGEWSAPFALPVVAIHQVLLPTGNVMMWDAGDFTSAPPQLWDPQTGTLTPALQNNTDLFCAGHAMLADGRLLTVGGDTRTTGLGVTDVNQFNPFTSTWSSRAPMANGRWYPSAITLSDGRVLVMSGHGSCLGCLVAPIETYDPRTNQWTTLPPSADYIVPSYPFLFELPNNKVLLAGSYEGTIDTRMLDLNTHIWSVVDPVPIDSGSAVMFAPGKIMKAGKWANADVPYLPAHANAYVMDTSDPLPAWRAVSPMNYPRSYHVLTLLPDGTTLATGGSRSTDPGDISQAVLETEIWSPVTETWTEGARMQNARLYHGSAMLLPDGRVLVAGSGRYGSVEELNGELYSPPYLFKGPRPVITSAPTLVRPGTMFTVGTAETNITAVTMIRTGSMTHSLNLDQRFLSLPFSPTVGGVTVEAPANTVAAPPGYYLLFLINDAGVPSVGSFVRVPAPSEDLEPPTPVTGLSASGGLGIANLAWDAAADNVAVAGYRVYRSTVQGFVADTTTQIAQTARTTFTDSGLPAGTYYYRVAAYDANLNAGPPSFEASALVTADTQPSTVAITAPLGGATVSGTITVSANASDETGVAGVRFYLGGVALGAEDTSAPYSMNWNTTTATNGSHLLTAVARDVGGNLTTSAPIDVIVSNAASTGLVLALGFNEGAGSAAADSSGNGNHGVLTNATWTAGKFGSAAQLTGTTESWVTVADASSLDLTGGMTISAWVRPASLTADWRTIVLKERSGGLAYALYATDGASRPPAGYVNLSGSDFGVVAPSNLVLDTWTHVAVTLDGANLRLYVNGALVSARAAGGAIVVSSGALRIGGNSVWGEYFAGAIDDVRLYNRALTQTAIQNDMNTPVP